MWTNTCCSHPLAVADEQESEDGRGVKNAAQRKILNELGVEANDCPVADIKYLTRILYSASSSGKWAEHELDYILFLTSATGMTVEPNPNEVMSTEYVGREELDDFVRAAKAKGEGITPWFELIANSLLPMWWKNIGQIERHQDHRNIKRF
jgi:isopentenyl-diphosphate delta-isomerase